MRALIIVFACLLVSVMCDYGHGHHGGSDYDHHGGGGSHHGSGIVTETQIAETLTLLCIKQVLTGGTIKQFMAVCPVSCRETGKQEQFVTYIGNQKFSVTHPKKTLVLKRQEETYNLTIDSNIGSLWIDAPCGCTFQDNENITTYPTYRCIDKTITYGRRHLVPAVWSQFQGLTLPSWDSTLPQFDNLHNCLNKNWIEENVKSSSTPVITYFVVINFLLIVSIIFTNAYLYVKLKKKIVYYERHKLNPADKKTFEIGSVKFRKAKTTYTRPKDRPLPEPIQEETEYLDPNEVNIPSTSSATPSSIIQHSSPMMPTSNPVTPTTSTSPSHYVPMNKSQYVPFSKMFATDNN
ncbi:hypothetical protein RN001_000252 [Aquatica leii]|uniref:Uncharacterized protein n=1 Tax=Aquatica leii TaxID=1421715 RepID=A0AAN7SC47_9COLE|nr:hypothetical protein RN001_000252 [Aquatica leii]